MLFIVIVFIALHRSIYVVEWQIRASCLLILEIAFLTVNLYHDSGCSLRVQPLMLLAGIAATLGTRSWVSWQIKHSQLQANILAGLTLFVILVSIGSLLSPSSRMVFLYHNELRSNGIWSNPNIYGLLMGVCSIVTLGLLSINGLFASWGDTSTHALNAKELPRMSLTSSNMLYYPALKSTKWKMRKRKFSLILILGLLALASGITSTALYKSYSRGAWLGTTCGLGYLAANICKSRLTFATKEARKRSVVLIIFLFSIGVLLYVRFQHSDMQLIKRVVSICNFNDFSWRNRIAAWQGAMQMMAERPWFGFGSDRTQSVYNNYYLIDRVEDGSAIQVNDYYMLGTMLGIPSLFCFGAYIWLSLNQNAQAPSARVKSWHSLTTKRQNGAGIGPSPERSISSYFCKKVIVESASGDRLLGDKESEKESEETLWEWIKLVCRSGVVVLLIGFWFDGGLFDLPTASLFWILLEIGAT